MFPGYNTNGFAHHKIEDAVAILAGQGYRGIALTPDVHHLNPFDPDFPARTEEFRELLDRHGLKCVVETGARFLLDAHRKHQPTLVSPDPGDRAYRREFLEKDAVGLAAVLGAECVSFWSGTPTDVAWPSEWMDRLVEECKQLADAAAAKSIRLAFEPEPGMFVDTLDEFAELFDRVNHPAFGLTVDVGHLVCTNELPISDHLVKWKHVLWNIHIDDMHRGVHDHLTFGDGEVDFADVFEGLRRAEYAGGVYVELSRHSHDAVNTARKSKAFLDRFI